MSTATATKKRPSARQKAPVAKKPVPTPVAPLTVVHPRRGKGSYTPPKKDTSIGGQIRLLTTQAIVPTAKGSWSVEAQRAAIVLIRQLTAGWIALEITPTQLASFNMKPEQIEEVQRAFVAATVTVSQTVDYKFQLVGMNQPWFTEMQNEYFVEHLVKNES